MNMSAQRDYYEVLGVERKATTVQITESYRRLAIRFHPDKNPGDSEAADRFKEAARAFEVLSDENLRARYDRFGHAGLQGGPQHEFNDISDIFEAFGDMFGGGAFGEAFAGGRRGSRARKGRDVFCSVSMSLLEAARGPRRRSSLAGTRPAAVATAAGPRRAPSRCSATIAPAAAR